MSELDRLLDEGLTHHRAGRLAQAEASYRRVLALNAQDSDAHNLLGMAALARGALTAAADSIAAAVRINPRDERYHLNYARVMQAQEQPAAALTALDRVVALAPDHAEAWFNRGLVLVKLGRRDQALASFDQVLALKPDAAAAHYNRGNVLHEMHRHHDAERSYAAARALQPQNPEIHYNLGVVLAHQRWHGEALACFDAAIALKANYPEAHNNRGSTLEALKRPTEALAAYQAVLALRPDDAAALYNRGHVESHLKQHDAAAASYEAALKIDSTLPGLRGAALNARMVMGDWSDFDRRVNDVLSDVDAGRGTASPFALLALPATPMQQRRCGEAHARTLFPQAPGQPASLAAKASGKIRLGYFSPDFRSHPLGFLTAGLFERHDRTRFEVLGFSYGEAAGHDPTRQRLVAAFDRFVDIANTSDDDAVALARELGVDIAIDLAGYTLDARSGLFAARLAPVQVNYLGFPGTMGAAFMDYIVADRHVIPDTAREAYTEQIVFLPQSFQVNDDRRAISAPLTRANVGLEEAAVVLCSFNAAAKLNPHLFSVWIDVLSHVPQAVLWLIAESQHQVANLRAFAVRRGIAPERLIFADRRPYAEHLARLALADLALDTLPFNGGATTSDALWAGVPVLTCSGAAFASRMGASLLHAVGLPELITHSLADYRSLAIALATSRARLTALKAGLVSCRATAALFNTALTTRYLEDAYAQMHSRAVAGLAPAHIDARGP